jgi:hypothetical protein
MTIIVRVVWRSSSAHLEEGRQPALHQRLHTALLRAAELWLPHHVRRDQLQVHLQQRPSLGPAGMCAQSSILANNFDDEEQAVDAIMAL